MTILDPTSLVKTLDNINESYLQRKEISTDEALKASRWIAAQQGEKGSYRGLFAPTATDFDHAIRLFTGEKLECASARHIMGQEAARAVWLLGREDSVVREAYEKATHWMQDEPGFQQVGMYCCGRCSLSYWRHYWVGEFKNKAAFISKGIQKMQGYRLGDGKWRVFPFFYAIYTLGDLDLEAARVELKYAQPAIERYLKVTRTDDYAKRKTSILRNVLAKIT